VTIRFAISGEKGKVGVVRIQSFCDSKVISASFNLRRCSFCDLEKYGHIFVIIPLCLRKE